MPTAYRPFNRIPAACRTGTAAVGAERGGTESLDMDFPAFVAARSAALFRGALVLTGSREAAEDLLQETLERTCRKCRTIAAKDADAYVRRITVNLANDRWRRFRRTPAHPDNGGNSGSSADAPSVDTDGIVRKTRRKRVTAIAVSPPP